MAEVPEAFVAWLWESRRLGTSLLTLDGRQLQVIYPGRRWGSWGPDFRGALLALDGALLRGDVEVHRRPTDWRAHGHAGDPNYAATALHVVWESRSLTPDPPLPTVALSLHLPAPLSTLLDQWRQAPSSSPVRAPCRSPAEAARLLDAAGQARLEAKAARLEADLETVPPIEALMTGILETLGYSANVLPFRRLVERLPMGYLLALAPVEGEAFLTAILFGESGLLPFQRDRPAPDAYAAHLEALWRQSGRSGPSQPLGWRPVGSRPANSPARRLAAVVALLSDPAADQLAGATLQALVELPPRRVSSALRRLLLRSGHDYWRQHADFGRPLRRPGAVLGPERAADAIVNAVLPWAVAMGRRSPELSIMDAAVAAYRAHPPLSPNQITRHMARQLIGGVATGVVTSAGRQQGLIHIYQNWCDARVCAACPAGSAGRTAELGSVGPTAQPARQARWGAGPPLQL